MCEREERPRARRHLQLRHPAVPGRQQGVDDPFSAFGNLLLGVPLGITGPTGPLGSGLYTVVYDECQDGDFTAGQDARFADAFRVVVPADAPIIDLGATKENAQKVVDALKGAGSGIKTYNQLKTSPAS